MSWASILETGRGSLGFRLMVEGWPVMWVTDSRITATDIADGRLVLPGLSSRGLKISERSALKDAWLTCGGMSVTLTPSAYGDDCVSGFTRDVQPVALLSATGSVPGLYAGSSNWTTSPASSVAFASAAVAHIGTEAVRVVNPSTGLLERGVWETIPQVHLMLVADQIDNPTPIYDWPPTMEGRRANLYAYGETDAGSASGTLIWRGVVARPPRQNSDGLSWTLQLEPIISIFDQKIAANEGIEYRVRGVYHPKTAPLAIDFWVKDGNYVVLPTLKVTGFYEAESAWASAVNSAISGWLAANNMASIATASVKYSGGKPSWQLVIKPSVPTLDVLVLSTVDILDGSGGVSLRNGSGGNTYDRAAGDSGGKFVAPVVGASWDYPLSAARGFVGRPTLLEYAPLHETVESDEQQIYTSITEYTDDASPWPGNRIYLQDVLGLQVGSFLTIKNDESALPKIFELLAVNTADRFIEVDLVSGSSGAWLNAETVLVPLFNYGREANWANFMQSVVAQSEFANLGQTPHITDHDVNSAAWPSLWTTFPFHEYWRRRDYLFVRPTAVSEILREEFKATGWMATINAEAKVDVIQLPFVSQQRTAHHQLTDAEILPPGDGLVGKWPTWEAQRDGLVNIVAFKLGYNAMTDEFDDQFTMTLRMAQSIAEHKSGNKYTGAIAPKSTYSPTYTSVTSGSGLSFSWRIARVYMPSAEDATDMVLPYLRTLASDYAVVTVCVPFSKFGVLVGQIVEVTSEWIPNGLGGRGVVSRKAICVGREWALDPGSNEMGKLTLWFPRDTTQTAGYAPTARMTSEPPISINPPTDTLWDITFDPGNAYNVAWSEDGSGDALKHFAVGDNVRMIKRDRDFTADVFGTITQINYTTRVARVQFLAKWVPYVDENNQYYNMSFSSHGIETARQLAFCWIADTGGQLENGGAARQFL
jgi:hypothetical protein